MLDLHHAELNQQPIQNRCLAFFQSLIQTHKTHKQRLTNQYVAVVGMLCGLASQLSFAAIPKPEPPPGVTGTNVWEIIVGWFKLAFESLLVIVAAASFVVAAYALVMVLYRVITGRDDYASLIGVFIVAIIATYFVGQMAYEGSEMIKQLTLT